MTIEGKTHHKSHRVNAGTNKKGDKRLIGLIHDDFIGDAQVERSVEAERKEEEHGKKE